MASRAAALVAGIIDRIEGGRSAPDDRPCRRSRSSRCCGSSPRRRAMAGTAGHGRARLRLHLRRPWRTGAPRPCCAGCISSWSGWCAPDLRPLPDVVVTAVRSGPSAAASRPAPIPPTAARPGPSTTWWPRPGASRWASSPRPPASMTRGSFPISCAWPRSCVPRSAGCTPTPPTTARRTAASACRTASSLTSPGGRAARLGARRGPLRRRARLRVVAGQQALDRRQDRLGRVVLAPNHRVHLHHRKPHQRVLKTAFGPRGLGGDAGGGLVLRRLRRPRRPRPLPRRIALHADPLVRRGDTLGRRCTSPAATTTTSASRRPRSCSTRPPARGLPGGAPHHGRRPRLAALVPRARPGPAVRGRGVRRRALSSGGLAGVEGARPQLVQRDVGSSSPATDNPASSCSACSQNSSSRPSGRPAARHSPSARSATRRRSSSSIGLSPSQAVGRAGVTARGRTIELGAPAVMPPPAESPCSTPPRS